VVVVALLTDDFRTWGSTVVSLVGIGAGMEGGVVLPLAFHSEVDRVYLDP